MLEQGGEQSVKAVVMAGGEGSRLRPITVNLPKPLVPVANRPIMGHIIELLKSHGVTDIVTTLHYLADEIQHVFGDGTDYGVNITHSLEDIPLGTAGSVKQAEVLLKDSTFIIISGDALTDCNLTDALRFHREKKSVATLVLSRVANPRDFGIVMTDSEGKVERFLEKPDWGEVFSDTVNTGIYILEPEVFDLIQPRTKTDWSQDVFPQLLEQNAPMYGYIMDDYWCDIGTLEQYREAQDDFLSGKTKLSIPGEQIEPGVWVGQNTVIHESVTFKKPVCIGDNVRIKRGAKVGPGAVIGNSCLIEENANIRRTVLWDRCYAGIETEIQGAIIGSRVTIKRDSRIQDGAVIGDRTLIDVGSTVRSKVKIWPDKVIERGSTISMSLVVGNRWRGALFRDLGVAGLSNIELTPDFATRLGLAIGSTVGEGTEVLVCRDSSKSSRMLKRSLMGALLSTGCQVTDMHGEPMPVFRHALANSDARAGVSVRKSPGNNRLSLIECLDENGAYLSRNVERRIEAAFFREDFHRTDPENLGIIQDSHHTVESYSRDLLRQVPKVSQDRRPKIVIDYGYSSVSPIFPGILGKTGIDAMALNAYNDARSAPRRPAEIADHISNLQQIVANVQCEIGVLMLNEGENIVVVDDQGLVLSGNTLFAAMCQLITHAGIQSKIAMGVTAPKRLEELLKHQGIEVIRSRSGVRDIMSSAALPGVGLAGNDEGGFIFPNFHPGYDGLLSTVLLTKLLQLESHKLSTIVSDLPDFHLAYTATPCPWDVKGKVMRILSESNPPHQKVEMIEGLKFYNDDSWVLVLPDGFEPVIHIYAESASLIESQALIREYSEKVQRNIQ